VENHVCLSRGVQVIGVTWWAVMRIMAGVRDLVQKTGDDEAYVGYSAAARSRGRVTLCVVSQGDEERGSLGLALKPILTVSPGLGLQTDCYGLVIWTSKSPRWFLGLGFKMKQAMVCGCTTKLMGG
jgi:hypothetical protein